MKHRKNLPALLLALMLALGLTACGPAAQEETPPEEQNAADTQPQQEDTQEQEPQEPETDEAESFDPQVFLAKIGPALDCLDSCDEELFGAEVTFDRAFSAGYDSEGPEAKVNALYPEGEALPAGSVQDPAYASYYPVTNANTAAELKEGLLAYMGPELAESKFVPEDFLEFDGKLYLCRGGRGYGALRFDRSSLEYVGEQNGVQQVKLTYKMFDEYDHDAVLSFADIDGTWKLTAMEEVM